MEVSTSSGSSGQMPPPPPGRPISDSSCSAEVSTSSSSSGTLQLPPPPPAQLQLQQARGGSQVHVITNAQAEQYAQMCYQQGCYMTMMSMMQRGQPHRGARAVEDESRVEQR